MKINHFPPSIKIPHLNFNVFLRIYPIVIISAISLFMTGCNPIYYAPNSLNVPLFSEASEVHLTLAGNKRQAQFQRAYALTDNFALLVNGGLFARNTNERGNEGSGKFLEAGGGYLHPIDDNWVFEG